MGDLFDVALQQMTDTLRGLSYMHELKPDPIAHGDIKSVSVVRNGTTESILTFDLAQYTRHSG